MCGIAGFVGGAWLAGTASGEALAEKMIAPISHRGPDHGAVWADGDIRVAFGHRRLAIIDLSPAGNQPMHSASGRWTIVYNGEIYNHLEIRRELEEIGAAPDWNGHSDTETLLAAIEKWGLERALERCAGMFALALWDRSERVLQLARDRVGEKPLYHGWQGEGVDRAFLFGSELKALTRHPSFVGGVNREALSLYMRHGYVPAPHSIYRDLFKLPAGSILTLKVATGDIQIQPYWSARQVAERGVANPITANPEEIVDSLEALLSKAVGQQMISDVPLGAFLSGGVDSSTVVALMQAQSTRPVRTFSIGFHEEAYNEAVHAKAVAAHIGTDHVELYVTPNEAMEVIPTLPDMYDEPFADSSQIPTFLVSKLARQHVIVALSGDGGDELFAGYERYRITERFWKQLSRVPRPLRAMVARGLVTISPPRWNRLATALKPILPASAHLSLPGDKIHKGAGVLASRSVADLYHGLTSSWRDPADLVIGGSEPETLLTQEMGQEGGLSDIERMMAVDLLTYLPDDILVKVDRAAMRNSLETRVPLLDHRLIEFAWSVPMEHKLRDGAAKWALRQVLYRHVPNALIDRPKMGFGIPVGDWLRGPLRDWAEQLLDKDRLAREGFLRPEPIRALWAAHLSGQVNEQYRLWVVLMFQAWLEADQERARLAGIARAA